MGDTTWLLRLPTSGDGPRLAVKDCFDVRGTVTTAGCRAIAETAAPATVDAPVVANARAQGARIVGKTNLVELCRKADGINDWTGTPVNPADPARIPGGSSSGSAVAVANNECDVAYGTDTGGSIRIPAACCGIAGLKTTATRVPAYGVLELSRTLDTVGPLARDVAGLALGMSLMEPGFTMSAPRDRPLRVARLRLPDVEAGIDAAIDVALAAAGAAVTDVDVPDWQRWIDASDVIMIAEGWWSQRWVLDLGIPVTFERGIRTGGEIPAAKVAAARRVLESCREWFRAVLRSYDVVVLPTLADEPAPVGRTSGLTGLTVPLNVAGLPVVSLPVPRPDGGFVASLQLVGGWLGEERLLADAAVVERAVAR